MEKYVTLNVRSGEEILLHFRAKKAGVPVKVVSGANETLVTADTDWGEDQYFLSDGTEMKIYGELNGFGSGNNGAKVTGIDLSTNPDIEILGSFNNGISTLDISHNPKMKLLECSLNNFPTEVYNKVFCDLPDRTGDEAGLIYIARNTSDAGYDAVLKSSASIARAKNWKVLFSGNQEEVPTIGEETCK